MAGSAIGRAPMGWASAPAFSPYPVPAAGAPLRLAFVGQKTFFEACALADESPEVHAAFFEFRGGADPERLRLELRAFRPHVVVVFRPEIIPHGFFADLPAATLGWLTEPIPRGTRGAHPDQQRRLWELRHVDASNFDRIVSFDPLIAQTAGGVLDVWRSLPLPVADRYFADVRPITVPPRGLFVGRSTEHREAFLTPVKHQFDLMHVAFGVDANELERLLGMHDIGVNIHNEPYESFENRVPIHLAAGQLVLSEPLSPLHGLEPGIDFIQLTGPAQLAHTFEVVARFPAAFDRIRIRGRQKAELFRASRVYPRLIADLLRDLAVHGGRRDTGPEAHQSPVRAGAPFLPRRGIRLRAARRRVSRALGSSSRRSLAAVRRS
jgi:hypothetical protein